MKHLLLVASTEYDGGSCSRCCPAAEYQQRRKDTVGDAGLMFSGSIYLFVRHHCNHWNLQTNNLRVARESAALVKRLRCR